VFNHSVNHAQLTKTSGASLAREVGAPGVQSSWARPPYGAWNARVKAAYAAKGMRLWLWDVDTLDWRGCSQAQVVRHAVSHSRAGSTALMHMQWRGFSPSAIAQIKSGLAKKGLQVCRNHGRPAPVKARLDELLIEKLLR